MELLDLLEKGFVLNGVVLNLKILNFILDAPSRTSCKAMKHINAYFVCDVCLAEGDCIDHRMAYLDLEAPLRNDSDYRSRVYEDYHKAESVLEMLLVDMVDSFPLDYLHCVLLGVMKRMLEYFLYTSKQLSTADYVKINRRIDMFARTQPVEFQHNLRSFITDLGLMKGTELRQCLLYLGPLLLQGIVNEEKIGNFLKLHIASTIFSHKSFARYFKESDELMRMFIQEFAEIYDPRHVVYTAHSLCHLKRFVDIYGPWDNFLTFEYDSYNCTVKNLLKGNVMPLTQITNRIVEIYNVSKWSQYSLTGESNDVEIRDKQQNGNFTHLKYYDLCFKTNRIGQNFVLLKSGQAVKMLSISQDINTSKVVLSGIPFKRCFSVFEVVDTTRFNIFKSKPDFGDPIVFEITDIDGKMWELGIDGSNMSAYYPMY